MGFLKKNILYILFLFASNYGLAQYITHADAFLNSTDDYCKCITITPNEFFNSGSFWNETPLDLSESFEIIVKPNFGCITASPDGGDGIAFVLQTNGTNQLPTGDGGNLGYNGISPSLVVQFDTYRDNPLLFPDNNDPGGGFFPYYDHVGLMKNGSCNHETTDDLSTVPFSPTFTDLTVSPSSASVLWSFGNGATSTQMGSVINTYDSYGCYDVTLISTTAEGCTDSLTQEDFVCVNSIVASFYPDVYEQSVINPIFELLIKK